MPDLIKPVPAEIGGEKCCPFIPPIISTKQAQLHYQFMPCMGERCRLWDHCQGDYSPKRIQERADERLMMVFQSLEEFAKAVPGLGVVKSALVSMKDKLLSRLSSGFKSA